MDNVKAPAESDPAISDSINTPLTRIEELSVTGSTQKVDISRYHLTLEGLVDNPLSLTYDEVLKYPAVTGTILLVCPDLFTNNAQWTGVPVKTLLTAAGVRPGATRVTFTGTDGYRQTLSLEDAGRPGVLLAYLVDGTTLPPEHGYPLRLVAKGQYGNVWVKWVEHIIIS